MASAQDTNVLLETVEIYSYQGAKSPQVGNVQKGGNTDSIEPKGAMALSQNPGYSGRYDQ